MTGSFPWIRPLLWRVQGYFWILLIIGCWAAEQDSSLENPRITEHPQDHYVSVNNPTKLDCSVDGDPMPTVTWYRNGEKVATDDDEIMNHRLHIKQGKKFELFFLRIIHEEGNTPDIGNYYCNATNIYGSAISNTAAIKLSVLEDKFKKVPTSQVKAIGERAEFQCIPPYGAPRATVQWAHEGIILDPVKDPTIIVTDRDFLVIPSVDTKDAGEYTCIASNKGGEKESDAAVLTVLEKPYFVEMPPELKVSVDATVELKCRAVGDPKPSVTWHKEDGRIAFGRARQLDDGTLRIEKVEIGDEGVYVCVAENVAGTAEAVGKLEVETQPSFLIPPKDITVALGRTAVLQCVVTGNPEPTVFWNVGNDKNLIFPNIPNGRFNMSEDGTLRIHNVQFSDQRTYECKALNVLGKANHSATVTVMPDDDRLPPVIVAGPQNQTLSPGKVAMLTCLVRSPKTGEAPQITWYKDGGLLLVSTDTRITELNSGTLQISDVRQKDSGRYTCKAVSETGETEWSAFLTVSKQGTSHRSQPQSAFPEAPVKLRVSDIADTSVRLTWSAGGRSGQHDVEGYVVEYFSPQTPGGWQTAPDSVSLNGYTVRNLQPDTKYVFTVRARNEMGVGPPSSVSGYVTTREKRRNSNVNLPKEEIQRELKKLRIELKQGQGINATHIKVAWEIRDSLSAVEGYLVNYTYLIDLDPMTYGTTEVIKVADAYKLRARIGGLRAASWYQVCVRAYARDQTSPWSNSINVLTMESVPSRPPTNIIIQEEDNSFHIEWSPPDPAYQNGDIIGYDIDCLSKVDQKNCSARVRGRDTSVVISKVTVDGSYRIRVAARTSKGRGVWSNEIIMATTDHISPMTGPNFSKIVEANEGPEKTTLIQEAWFVWVLVGTIGGTLWLALCVFSIWLFRRRRRNNKKKMAQNGMYSAVPVHKSDESGRPGGGIGRDDVIYSQKEGNIHTAYGGLQSDLASLLECGHKEGTQLGDPTQGGQLYSAASVSGAHSKSYYQRPPGGPCPPPPPSASSVAPYATTTLINKGVNPQPRQGQTLEAPGGGFRPINHAYVHSSASGSGDSCHKPDVMRSSDSNTDNSRPNTGHYSYAAGCCPHEHFEGLASPSSDSGSVTTDENGMQVKRPHKYSRIGGPTSCPNCTGPKQGQPGHMNLAELLPPPPEHPPPHHEMMMVGRGPPGSDMGSCSLQRHNAHAYLYGNETPGPNMAETRFIENRYSPASACSYPAPAPHMGGVRNYLSGNAPGANAMPPYSDIEYPVHSHGNHAPHSLHHAYPHYNDGSGGSAGGGGSGGGGNSYGCERPYSPKLLNTGRGGEGGGGGGGGGSSSGSNRCQSPLSCHNCGSSYPPPPQQQVQQAPPPPAPPSSSSSNNSQHHHHHLPQQHQQQQFNPNTPHYHYQNNHTDPRMIQSQGGGAYNHQPVALHGYRIPPMEAEYKSPEDEEGGVSMDRACQSSLPSLANDSLQAGYGRRADSPPSEDHHDYGLESDMDGQQRLDCPTTPDSSVNGEGGSASGSMQLAWPSATDDDTDSVSHDDSDNNHHHHRHHHTTAAGGRDGVGSGGGGQSRGSGGTNDDDVDDDDDDASNSSDSSFLADADFASAVARAAQLSGLTVVGTTVTDPKSAGNAKKYRKHRNAPARPHSPYSTDSNMSAIIHKPYPKSERKKQLMEQARKYGQRKDGGLQNMDIEEAEGDLPAYHRPYYPTFPRHHGGGAVRAVLSDNEGGGDYSGPASFLYPQLHQLHPSPFLRSTNGEASFAAKSDMPLV